MIATVNDLRTLFLILAFVSIGLEFRVAPLREAGWRPVGVFASATVVNLLVGLGLATLRHRALALHDEHLDLHAELITAEVAHHLAMTRSALHRHPSLRPD